MNPPSNKTLVSIITPAFNESKNLPALYERLAAVFAASSELEYEWVVVDDHSLDDTFQILTELHRKDARVRAFRLSRNCGSHAAMTCGFHQAKGKCAIVLAADLQDPPEVIPELLKEWHQGAQIVWAARRSREGEKQHSLLFSRLYYLVMRRISGLSEMPSQGADFFLVGRVVLNVMAGFPESNVSILALLAWIGFRQSRIDYNKQMRLHGRSGWTLKKKIKLFVDSITSFSYFPIRVMSYLGALVALTGFIYAGLIISEAFSGHRPQGWASLMIVVLTLGGLQMLMMGILGEYLWRSLEESRRRPRFIIENSTDAPR